MESITSTEGTAVSFERYGSGPPLVLVHGGLTDHNTGWFVVKPLLQERFTVYAIDRRGRGETTATRGHSIQQEFSDVAAVIRSVGAPVFMIGHSYGAHCALGGAAIVPDLVQKLVLYEPPSPHAMRPAVIAHLEESAAQGAWDEVLTAFLRDAIAMPVDEIEALKKSPFWQMLVVGVEATMHDIRALIRYQFEADAFASLSIPVLLLVGTESPRDIYVTEAVAASMPQAQIVELEGQAHAALVMAPQLFVDKVTAFL